jgi:hypothetical protein
MPEIESLEDRYNYSIEILSIDGGGSVAAID